MRMLYSHEVPCSQSCFLKNDICVDYGYCDAERISSEGFVLIDETVNSCRNVENWGCDTFGCIENLCAIRPLVHLASEVEPRLLFDHLTVKLPKGTLSGINKQCEQTKKQSERETKREQTRQSDRQTHSSDIRGSGHARITSSQLPIASGGSAHLPMSTGDSSLVWRQSPFVKVYCFWHRLLWHLCFGVWSLQFSFVFLWKIAWWLEGRAVARHYFPILYLNAIQPDRLLTSVEGITDLWFIITACSLKKAQGTTGHHNNRDISWPNRGSLIWLRVLTVRLATRLLIIISKEPACKTIR